VKAVDVHHLLEGAEDAPVLVLSSSLGTTHAMWDAAATALAQRVRVLRYDTRGHGESPVPPGPYSVAELGGDLLSLLDRLGLERASFCGLSMGGTIGIWLGVNAPQRVDRLVLCSTAAHFPPREQWIERAALVRERGTAPLVEATLDRWFTPRFRDRDPATVEWIGEMLRATPAEGYASCCEALADFDMRGDLGAIRAPTLIIAAAGDPTATPERSRELEAAIAESRLAVVPAARHLSPVEQPEAVSRAVADHLAATAADAGGAYDSS
jgi:3-oxoadipate enol-lactonase